MKKTNFENFKLSLNLNIEVDASLRRITEKIKVIAQLRDPDMLRYVVQFLDGADKDLDYLINEHICIDDEKEE